MNRHTAKKYRRLQHNINLIMYTKLQEIWLKEVDGDVVFQTGCRNMAVMSMRNKNVQFSHCKLGFFSFFFVLVWF